MNLACPHCRHEQDVADPKPGQGVQCPACFKVFVPFPNPPQAPIPPAASPLPPPLPPPCAMPANADAEHLRLLRTFHFVVGGILGAFSCLAMIHITLGIVMIASPEAFDGRGNGQPPFFGWLFLVAGLMALLVGWTIATLMFLGGKFLGRRTHYTFCFVVAAISCLFSPFGTVLGVFTIIVLSRQSVKQLFNEKRESV